MARKYVYRAWIYIHKSFSDEPGFDRYGSETFKTQREALLDAANIIREVKDDPAVEWRNDIETYGTIREETNRV